MRTEAGAREGINTAFLWDDELMAMYASWHRRVAAAERVHAQIAARLARRNSLLGGLAALAMIVVGVILLAPVVAPDLYARATVRIDDDAVAVAGAAIAAVAAVLVVVQLSARLGARAEDHRIASLRYASLGRAMTVTEALPRQLRDAPDDALTEVRLRVDRYSRESPRVRGRRRRKLESAFDRSAARAPDVTTDEPSAERRLSTG